MVTAVIKGHLDCSVTVGYRRPKAKVLSEIAARQTPSWQGILPKVMLLIARYLADVRYDTVRLSCAGSDKNERRNATKRPGRSLIRRV